MNSESTGNEFLINGETPISELDKCSTYDKKEYSDYYLLSNENIYVSTSRLAKIPFFDKLFKMQKLQNGITKFYFVPVNHREYLEILVELIYDHKIDFNIYDGITLLGLYYVADYYGMLDYIVGYGNLSGILTYNMILNSNSKEFESKVRELDIDEKMHNILLVKALRMHKDYTELPVRILKDYISEDYMEFKEFLATFHVRYGVYYYRFCFGRRNCYGDYNKEHSQLFNSIINRARIIVGCKNNQIEMNLLAGSISAIESMHFNKQVLSIKHYKY